MNRSIFAFLLLPLAAAAALSACSSDDSTDDTAADAGTADSSSTTHLDSGATAADSGTPTTTPDAGTPDAGTTDSGTTDSGTTALSFAASVYTPVITPTCLFCHGALPDGGPGIGIQYGKLDMSTDSLAYANLVGVAAAGVSCGTLGKSGLERVKAGDPTDSLIYNKLASNDGDGGTTTLADGGPAVLCGNPMPEHLGAISTADLNLVQEWIAGGAQP